MNDGANILITAVGSELAFAVIKAARQVSFPLTLHGCDMAEDVVGKYWCDQFHILPPAAQAQEYLDSIKCLIKRCSLNAIIPTADAEFEILATNKNAIRDELGCQILVNPLEEYLRFSDKWTAHQWYQEHNIATPPTYKAATIEEAENAAALLGFPLILKPRIGGGSRHILRIQSLEELRTYLHTVPAPLLQQCILPDEEEYTAGTYRATNGEIQVIILQRVLKFGMTNRARSLTGRQDLVEFCRDVISRTKLVGSNNIQFRIAPQGPQVLEINARFSGTTGIRAHCGFNDVEMWLVDALGLGPVPPPKVRERLVLRYMEELYVDC